MSKRECRWPPYVRVAVKGSAKLTAEDVRQIRSVHRRYVKGYGSYALGKLYGVSPSNIRQIIRGNYWKRI